MTTAPPGSGCCRRLVVAADLRRPSRRRLKSRLSVARPPPGTVPVGAERAIPLMRASRATRIVGEGRRITLSRDFSRRRDGRVETGNGDEREPGVRIGIDQAIG